MRPVRAGDIGTERRVIEVVPMPAEPGPPEPAPAPAQPAEPEKEPAHA